MTKHTTVFASMLRHLSRSEFENAVSGYNGDFKIRTLSCWDLFKSMLYALVSCCFSVREIEASMRANGNRLYHAGLKQIKRSTFCDALEKRRHGLFKSVFDKLADKAQNISCKMKKKFKDPLRIAVIYKERWEVELFFKWIKQHLKVKSFWGTSINAVYSQIWVALILTILIWINRTLDGITASPYELMIMMKSALLTKNSLIGLCTNILDSKPPDNSAQPFLEGFKC